MNAPLSSEHVKERKVKGISLSYIAGWWAIAEANRIFGYDAWDRETTMLQVVDSGESTSKADYECHYIAQVRVTVRGFSRPQVSEEDDDILRALPTSTTVRVGTGYGSGYGNTLGEAHESAIKEAETDAMKRALMTFGNPFGLALYDKDRKNVTDSPEEEEAPSKKVQHRWTTRVKFNPKAFLDNIGKGIDAVISLDDRDSKNLGTGMLRTWCDTFGIDFDKMFDNATTEGVTDNSALKESILDYLAISVDTWTNPQEILEGMLNGLRAGYKALKDSFDEGTMEETPPDTQGDLPL
jgi:DNA repair and recombination protein RAD52